MDPDEAPPRGALRCARAAPEFFGWSELLRLLQDAFVYMDGRIAPASSVHDLTPASLAAKARGETLFLATEADELVGCVFACTQGESLYVGKLAVRPDRQGNGIGRRLMSSVEDHALDFGVRFLDLDTRIELTENHETFAAMGFVRVAEHAHAGYDRPTFVRMRKSLVGRGSGLSPA